MASGADSFVLWVDGVGGYLVCANEINTIGRDVDHPHISIPILGDLRRRHARIETLDGQHVLLPLGGVQIDGHWANAPVEMKHLQTIEFDGGVKLRYTQSHPLSATGRLDFVSGHRTQPWSDGVLLVSQSIILGPSRNNHVFCPTWRFDVTLFRREDKWFFRAEEEFEIDGQCIENEGEIKFNSRIVGEDYSLTLEPI